MRKERKVGKGMYFHYKYFAIFGLRRLLLQIPGKQGQATQLNQEEEK